MWGSIRSDTRGDIVEGLLDRNPISFFNDGSPTYHNIHTGYSSSIDLSICSSNILLDYIWSVDEYLNDSDHYPIYLKSVTNTPSEASPKWKVEEANWGKYNQECSLDREFGSFEDHIKAYNYFVDTIMNSANSNIPKTSVIPDKTNPP